jgi:GTP cyclohydrolase II
MSDKTKKIVESRLPTIHGEFVITAFDSGVTDMPHLCLSNVHIPFKFPVNVRIHSECMTGDVFGSTRCDCGEQLAQSMQYLQDNGGILIYLRQEGRGIGLVNKLKAYNLQDGGLDTIEANHALGFSTDSREYSPAINILKHLGITTINLLTNNPDKIEAFENSGIEIVERIPVSIKSRPENRGYLKTKKEDLGHLLHQL